MSTKKKGVVSLKIQRRSFREIEDFRLGRLPTSAITLQEVVRKRVFRFRVCLGEGKKWDFRVPVMSFILAKAWIFSRKIGSSPRRRKVGLGESVVRPGKSKSRPGAALVRLGEPEKFYCKLLEDLYGSVVANFVARFVKCPWHAQSMI